MVEGIEKIKMSAYSIPGLKECDYSLSYKTVISIVCRHFEITNEQLLGTCRRQKYVFPRYIAMYLIREQCKVKLIDISDIFSGRDHSSVVHAIQKIDAFISIKDETVINCLREIRKKLSYQ